MLIKSLIRIANGYSLYSKHAMVGRRSTSILLLFMLNRLILKSTLERHTKPTNEVGESKPGVFCKQSETKIAHLVLQLATQENHINPTIEITNHKSS
jgi:hypothetical protein